MKQVVRKTANYAADLAGINSALYELGGLIVMHDASGCNSTYATHDEPRWYAIDSLIFISGLEEYDAILGNDDKLIKNIIEAAEETKPNFIAIFGSPIALLMGTDFKGIAYYIEKETGIPCFGFKTSGMASYVFGASQAFSAIAQRFCSQEEKTEELSINLLGMTPLDFGYNGNVEALDAWCKENDFSIVSNWSMNTNLEQIKQASKAHVNLVLSSTALEAAKELEKKFNIPYVVGVPCGSFLSRELSNRIKKADLEKKSYGIETQEGKGTVVLIGEPVFMNSLRICLKENFGICDIQIICPTEITEGFLSKTDCATHEECEIEQQIEKATLVIADPLYQPLVKNQFLALPHWAYSGRMYRDSMPIVIGETFKKWLKEQLDV